MLRAGAISNAARGLHAHRFSHDGAQFTVHLSDADGTKSELVVERLLGPARERRAQLEGDPDYVEDVLVTNAKKARKVAQEVMADVYDACGLLVGKDTHR